MEEAHTVVALEAIEPKILLIRGQRVMLDSDLARLYGVPIRRLNEQVKRNRERFPEDFMFQLTAQEAASLRSHFATLKAGRGQHRKYLPYAFTEHGAIMVATVLNAPRAIEASLYVVRAFVRMREVLNTRKDFAAQLAEIEKRLAKHDIAIHEIIEAIQRLAALPLEPEAEKPKIGFGVRERRARYQRRRLKD